MKSIKEFLRESKYPLADKWMSGKKELTSGSITLVRGNGGVHKINKKGKTIGDFSLDDNDLWVINIKGKKGQVVAREIDDIFKELK